ncbi:MAG: hypothetical protein AB7T31_18060 [Gemmatimonadales bacterium]
MTKLLRSLRGAIGMGLTWALGWLGVGAVLQLIIGPGVDDVPLPIRFAILGFLSGVTFSGFLKLVAGRRRFDQLSLGRFAAWGGAGGLVLSGILAATAGPGGEPLLLVPVLALAGAVSAAGTLSLARRAEMPRLAEPVALLDDGDGERG